MIGPEWGPPWGDLGGSATGVRDATPGQQMVADAPLGFTISLRARQAEDTEKASRVYFFETSCWVRITARTGHGRLDFHPVA